MHLLLTADEGKLGAPEDSIEVEIGDVKPLLQLLLVDVDGMGRSFEC